MRYLIYSLFIALFLSILYNANASAKSCIEKTESSSSDVVYKTDSQLPAYLRGARVTVTLADGRSSTVPAEKFMVVPRKSSSIVGKNSATLTKQICDNSSQNIIMLEGRKDVTGMETREEVIAGGVKASTSSKKEFVPGLNYYRRNILRDVNNGDGLGLGIGIDSNGTVKGLVGVEF